MRPSPNYKGIGSAEFQSFSKKLLLVRTKPDLGASRFHATSLNNLTLPNTIHSFDATADENFDMRRTADCDFTRSYIQFTLAEASILWTFSAAVPIDGLGAALCLFLVQACRTGIIREPNQAIREDGLPP